MSHGGGQVTRADLEKIFRQVHPACCHGEKMSYHRGIAGKAYYLCEHCGRRRLTSSTASE